MNVTLKLPDEACRKARHFAVDEKKSLSGWVATLVQTEILRREELKGVSQPKTWMEALEDSGRPDEFYEKDLPLPDRSRTRLRKFAFEADED